MNKMSEAFTKIVDESQRRDKTIEELFIRINQDIRTRDKRTEARVEGTEKHIDAEIDEKFSHLEARISAVEKKVWNKRKDIGKSANRANRMQSSGTQFQRRQQRRRCESFSLKLHQSDVTERCGIHNRLPCETNHTCICGIPKHEDQGQIRQISRYSKS